MASNPGQKTEETSSIQGRADENFEIRGAEEERSMVEGLSEIGGIALGAVAFLVPGLGPVLSGGPVAGQAVGDTVGHYMSAQMDQERREEYRQENRLDNQQAARESADLNAGAEAFFLAVDTYTDEEADFASNIMEQHGGKVTRMTINEDEDHDVQEEEVRYVPADAETRYVAKQDGTQYASRQKTQEIPSSLRILSGSDLQNTPAASIAEQHDLPDLQGVPVEPDTQYAAQAGLEYQVEQGQPSGQGELHTPAQTRQQEEDARNRQFPQFPAFPQAESGRTVPAEDGYDLDPVAPLSPQNWIDPNIGLGNFDLYDPATRTRDNSQRPETDIQ